VPADAASLSTEDIKFERRGRAGVVTLARPKALNAVNHDMVNRLSDALDVWASDDGVALVAIKAEGRAFSAGGDIMAIYEAGRAGNPIYGFFADEYRLNAKIARYPKPYVALVDGIVMGGGVGVSCHGTHRVMTENAVFAMPEVGIGFFPDVGGSHILPRLPNDFGMYLALTGNRIRWGDALWSGLATHAAASADLPAILDALCETGDPDAAIVPFEKQPARETDDGAIHEISRLFAPETLDDLVQGIRLAAGRGDELAASLIATLEQRSPTSLNVAFAQVRAGAMLDIAECMRMEYRILVRMLQGHDFYEGIRAAIVEKGSKPVWKPATLAEVTSDEIDAYFAPLGGDELEL
jgi:enoyl-CoA hydratase